MKVLLDTNIVLWMLLGAKERVPAPVVRLLETPDVDLATSAASVWEIAIKRSLGKLTIEDRWLAQIPRHGIAILPIGAVVAAAVEALPFHHRDPFDRLIVAHADHENRTLATADTALAAYGVPLVV